MTTTPHRPVSSGPGSTSLIPVRIDRLPWSRFRTHPVAALTVAWTPDGLQITIASNAGPDLICAGHTVAVAGLTRAATREGPGLHAAEADPGCQPPAGADFAPAESDAAALALERGLGLAGPERVLLPALIRVALGLLERHAGNGRAEAALTCAAANLPGQAHRPAPPPGEPAWPDQPLTASEARVLRYLPTHLGAPQIAAELYLSANTVKTHLRHLYRKLGVHNRQEAVQRARATGLLTVPSGRRWHAGRPDGPEYPKADRRPAQIVSLSYRSRPAMSAEITPGRGGGAASVGVPPAGRPASSRARHGRAR
jgi:DNA-binding CsgD family transcriptional regulator